MFLFWNVIPHLRHNNRALCLPAAPRMIHILATRRQHPNILSSLKKGARECVTIVGKRNTHAGNHASRVKFNCVRTVAHRNNRKCAVEVLKLKQQQSQPMPILWPAARKTEVRRNRVMAASVSNVASVPPSPCYTTQYGRTGLIEWPGGWRFA